MDSKKSLLVFSCIIALTLAYDDLDGSESRTRYGYGDRRYPQGGRYPYRYGNPRPYRGQGYGRPVAPVYGKPVHHVPVHHDKPVHPVPVHHGKPVVHVPVHHDKPVHHAPVHHNKPVHPVPVHHDKPVHHVPVHHDKPVHHAPVHHGKPSLHKRPVVISHGFKAPYNKH